MAYSRINHRLKWKASITHLQMLFLPAWSVHWPKLNYNSIPLLYYSKHSPLQIQVLFFNKECNSVHCARLLQLHLQMNEWITEATDLLQCEFCSIYSLQKSCCMMCVSYQERENDKCLAQRCQKTIARVSTVHSEGRFNHLIRCIHNAISSVQSWIKCK